MQNHSIAIELPIQLSIGLAPVSRVLARDRFTPGPIGASTPGPRGAKRDTTAIIINH